jgi:uncharacterized membrane protein
MEVINLIISWSHILTASASMVLGFLLLVRTKGNSIHMKYGKYYYYCMLINNITALFIYNATGKWFFPHSLAVATLILIIPSYYILRIRTSGFPLLFHIIGMVLSYYMLIGGAVNEAFLHTPALRHFMIEQSPVFGLTHFAVQLIFLTMLIYFPIRYRKFNKTAKT